MARKPKGTIVMEEKKSAKKPSTPRKTNKKTIEDAEKELFSNTNKDTAEIVDEIDVFEIDPETGERISDDGDDELVDEIKEYKPTNEEELAGMIYELYKKFSAGEKVSLGMISLSEYKSDSLSNILDTHPVEFYDIDEKFFDGIEQWDVRNIVDFTACFAGYVNFKKNLTSWKIRPDAKIGGMFLDTGYENCEVKDVITLPAGFKLPRSTFSPNKVRVKIRRVAR